MLYLHLGNLRWEAITTCLYTFILVLFKLMVILVFFGGSLADVGVKMAWPDWLPWRLIKRPLVLFGAQRLLSNGFQVTYKIIFSRTSLGV